MVCVCVCGFFTASVPMPSALQSAEQYVSSLEEEHGRTLLMLSALQQRFLETVESREEAVAALEKKRKQYSSSLQSVKLVSARMIQEREAHILSLAQQGKQTQ